MTGYFYTDPLAAAWMNKHFGMQVTRTHCHLGDGTFGESTRPVPIWILARDVENQVSEHVKYYVHPDSLYLLNPIPEDVAEFAGEFDSVFELVRLEKYREKFIARPKNFIAGEHHFSKIVQRNSLQFFWPEVEP